MSCSRVEQLHKTCNEQHWSGNHTFFRMDKLTMWPVVLAMQTKSLPTIIIVDKDQTNKANWTTGRWTWWEWQEGGSCAVESECEMQRALMQLCMLVKLGMDALVWVRSNVVDWWGSASSECDKRSALMQLHMLVKFEMDAMVWARSNVVDGWGAARRQNFILFFVFSLSSHWHCFWQSAIGTSGQQPEP